MVTYFPHASRSSRLPSVVPSVAATCFWLVVVLKIMRLEAAESHDVFFIIYDCETLTPHIPPPPRSHALPNILSTANANFWLVVVFSQPERQPPKAKPPPPSLFYDGLRFSTQNKGTNCGAA